MNRDFVAQIEQAEQHLRAVDPELGTLIETLGPEHWPHYRQPPFYALLRAIIGQQLSTKAADAIESRVLALLPDAMEAWPTALFNLPNERLHGAGLSQAKIRTLNALSEQIHNDPQGFADLSEASDEQVRQTLCELPGIGPWTVDMYLMFGLNRLDVFSGRDLGLRKAVTLHLGLDNRLSAEACEAIAERWKPYRTVAAWHLWRLVD